MNEKNNQLLVKWVLGLNPPRKTTPDSDVIRAIAKYTGYELTAFLQQIPSSIVQQKMKNYEDFSFLRSVEELEAILEYFPVNQFAPFGVCYQMSKKRTKKKVVDWYIDIYGVCFAGQFANHNKVAVWTDHAYVYDWPTFDNFINHWS